MPGPPHHPNPIGATVNPSVTHADTAPASLAPNSEAAGAFVSSQVTIPQDGLRTERCAHTRAAPPVAIDLFCGLGGWTDGLLANGWRVIGYDIEAHEYGEHRYPAELVLADVRELHGSQFADAGLIVASPPCQEHPYMAMPWKRAKQIARALRGEGEFPEGYTGSRTIAELNELFNACFRIQREACEAAGRHIPMVVENVRGAQPWVGRAAWNYGSYYLWGDVPALMPPISHFKNPGFRFDGSGRSFQTESVDAHVKVASEDAGRRTDPGKGARFTSRDCGLEGRKNSGGSWFNIGSPGQKMTGMNPDGRKQPGISGTRANGMGDKWFQDGAASHGSKSHARKAASALIAKIPRPLSDHIARVYQSRALASERAAA